MKKCFVDSNVFLYRVDGRHPAKRAAASERLQEWRDSIVISAQVLQEFYWVATRKLEISPNNARLMVQELASAQVVPADERLVLAAVDTAAKSQISFWDALVVEAAVRGKCSLILTEDLNHGEIIRGVRIENPFL
jgi:predicted nucleic acid-binding protein